MLGWNRASLSVVLHMPSSLNSSSWTENTDFVFLKLLFFFLFFQGSLWPELPSRQGPKPLQPPVKWNRVIRLVIEWKLLGSCLWGPRSEAPLCSHVQHCWIVRAVLIRLSRSPWHIYTSVRYLHMTKQLASYKRTMKQNQAECKQLWSCLTLRHWWWLLFLPLCFYALSSVFMTSYIKLHCMTTPTKLSRGHVNKLSPKQCLQGEQVTNSSVFSFYLLWGSGEERGKKRTSSCFEESYSKSEKKIKGKIDLSWLNIFVISLFCGGCG